MELNRLQKIMSSDNTGEIKNLRLKKLVNEKNHESVSLYPLDVIPRKFTNKSPLISPLNLFASENTGTSENNHKLINENSRVLHIGDSHTVGYYGKQMDELLRSTGAKVRTYGSSGSAPSSWTNGYVTKSGFYFKDENGKEGTPKEWKIITPEFANDLKTGKKKEWQTPTKTPNLNTIINEYKPNVIVFSLGANLMKAKGETIEKQVKEVCEIAKATGAKIVWVGPPDGRADKKPVEEQNRIYSHIEKIASQYGVFVDSRPVTEYPSNWGGDGVHFWGNNGKKMANEWAGNVFSTIQSSENN